MGGDHGQSSYVFIAIILIRYEDTNKETYRVEVKLGEINQEKDKLEYLKPLIKKISFSLDSMKINTEGNAIMSIDNLKTISFVSNDNETSDTKYLCKFYLIGDLKSLFTLLGRDRYDSKYCLYCSCKPLAWKV